MMKLLIALVQYATQCVVWTAALIGRRGVNDADHCPHCGRYFDWMSEKYFKRTDSGSYAPPGDVTVHWVRGFSY